MDNRPLYERYGPQTFDEVIGQDKVVGRLKAMRDRTGLAGRAYWLSGQSGTGKSTLAKLIASSVADEFFVEELDSQYCTPTRLKELEKDLQTRSWGKGGRAIIVNEAHGLSKQAVAQLLTFLERLPAHVVICFTTTIEGQEALFDGCDDASPLLSRCLRLDLARRDLAKPFAERALTIARAEGLDGRPLADYVRLVQKHRQNMRAVLQEIEAGSMLKGVES